MKYLFAALFISFSLLAQTDNEVEKHESLDFQAIKDVIKNDMLESEVVKQKEKVQTVIKQNKRKIEEKYQIPGEDKFWSFLSQMWLVRNAQIIKWDFQKPDYGIETAFEDLLEKLGYLEVRFKILVVNTPDITHFALPADPNNHLFIISLPFMRTLDLSKTEIALMLLEDMLRSQAGYFVNKVATAKVRSFIGSNFYGKAFAKDVIEDSLKKYDEIIFDRGFTFDQQFEVTKQMDKLIKADLNLWNSYFQMITKIDNLVKSNPLYLKYPKIYPSPELQLGWLRPQVKRNEF